MRELGPIERDLQEFVRAEGWNEEQVERFTRFVGHSACGSAEFALDVLDFARNVRFEQDAVLADKVASHIDRATASYRNRLELTDLAQQQFEAAQ